MWFWNKCPKSTVRRLSAFDVFCVLAIFRKYSRKSVISGIENCRQDKNKIFFIDFYPNAVCKVVQISFFSQNRSREKKHTHQKSMCKIKNGMCLVQTWWWRQSAGRNALFYWCEFMVEVWIITLLFFVIWQALGIRLSITKLRYNPMK